MNSKTNTAVATVTESRSHAAELRLRTRLVELLSDHLPHLLTVARVHLHPFVHLDEDVVQLVLLAALRGIFEVPRDKQDALSELHHWVAEVAKELRKNAPMDF